jgi:hypothetical protein
MHAYRMQTLENRHVAQVQAITHAPAPRPAAPPAQHGNPAQHGPQAPQGHH